MTKKVSKPSLEFTLNASFLCFFVDIGQYLLKLLENFAGVWYFSHSVYGCCVSSWFAGDAV